MYLVFCNYENLILQKDHLVAALDDLMSRYTPPVQQHRYKVRFVPVVEENTTPEQRAAILAYSTE